VSGGGVKYAWNSPLVIVLLTLGVILFVIFVIYEARYARIPIMPSTLKQVVVDCSASLHHTLGSIDFGSDIFCWNCILRQSLLFAYF
jgi:hypothetical protein